MPSTVLMDYKPYLNYLLRNVEKEWPKIVNLGSDEHPLMQCPLHFAAAEIDHFTATEY